jgi:hypothetical protein
VLALLFLGVLTPSASASPFIRYGIEDDAWLQWGPGTLDQRLDRVHSLGATVVRVTVDWSQVEPRKGRFDWRRSDELLDGLNARGIAPLVTLWGSPRWANGGRSANWAPTSGATFAAFARAAARRYPFVHMWTIWNEPNQRRSLRPTSPIVYTQRLLNPAYAAIHAASPSAKVAGGVTAPRAATGGVSPVAWIQGMAAAHARLDAYAHNPYALSPHETPFTGGCGQCSTITMATLGKLETLVGRYFPRARIWLTEYGYQTNPPDPFLGVSYGAQAAFDSEAALRAFELPRVDVLIHYLLVDEPNLARFQSGLISVSGTEKPSYDAFQFPLAEQSRAGVRSVLWGQVRPGSGRRAYRLQRAVGNTWVSVGGTAYTNARGVFTRSVSATRGTRFRIWVAALHTHSRVLAVA